MKIAILIGVENYNNANDLAACKADVDIIEKIITATGNYTDVLTLSIKTNASEIKSEISEFIEKYKDQSIDEVFFYFTGHGEYHDDEFYYVLSDYDESKRKQTSLENSEVDNWLRSLDPKLTVKVVDACHSGTTYIKDNSKTLSKYLEKSKSSLKNCYFMYSSHQEEASYQDDELSFFTKSFVDSLCKEDDATKIRYKDICDYISDDFDGNINQTPIFIMQASLTEIFCNLTPEIKSLTCIGKDETIDLTEIIEAETNKDISLDDLIKLDADKYCTEDEVEQVLSSIRDSVENYTIPDSLKSLYELSTSFKNNETPHYDEFLPNEDVIGKWVDKNKEAFFCKPYLEKESYEKEIIDRSAFTSFFDAKYRTVTKYRDVISGYENTANLSYDLIEIDSEPQLPNIPKMRCTVAIIISKTSIVLFRSFTRYEELDWNSKKLIQNVDWSYSIHSFKNTKEIIDQVNDIYEGFTSYIIDYLEAKFN